MKNWCKSHKFALAGALLLCLLAAAALVIPLISPYPYTEMNAMQKNQFGSPAHWLGTDRLGRDILVRVCCGLRISLAVGFGSALFNGGFGMLYGGAAGYFGKGTDLVLMRIADIIAAIPSLLYTILINLLLGGTAAGMVIGISVAGWIGTARIVRGEMLRLKELEYIAAARLHGVPGPVLFFLYFLPGFAGPFIINMTNLLSHAVFTEAFLSFTGIGIAAPQASLGMLIQDARSMVQVYPWQMLLPLLALCLLIFAANLIVLESHAGGQRTGRGWRTWI